MADNSGPSLQSEVPSTSTSTVTESVQSISNQRKRVNNTDVVPKRYERKKRGSFIFETLPLPEIEEEDELQHVTIREVGCRKSIRFGYDEKMYVLSLKDEIALNPPPDWDWITSTVNGMRRYAARVMQYQRGDKINIVVENPKFNNPVSTGYKWTGDAAVKLVNKIRDIITSDTSIQLKDCLFRIIVVKMPRGSGRSKIINLAEDKRTKQCIIQIKNRDNLCCPRAIITGK